MNEITIIGNSGIQFYDTVANFDEDSELGTFNEEFCIFTEGDIANIDKVYYSFSRKKYIMYGSINKTAFDKNGKIDDGKIDDSKIKTVDTKYIKRIKLKNIKEIFEGEWLPIPYFRKNMLDGNFSDGPYKWAKIWFNPISDSVKDKLDIQSKSATHSIVIAFDTLCDSKSEEYDKPTEDDMRNNNFIFIDNMEKLANGSFLSEGNFLSTKIEELLSKNEAKFRSMLNDENNSYEKSSLAVALYLTFLSLLKKSEVIPDIRFCGKNNDVNEIETDLVLDLGNSRTCGLIFESSSAKGNPNFSFNESEKLEIRDLGIPSEVYDEPFDMRCEFIKPDFGINYDIAMIEGLFLWPSLLRIGKEAARYSSIYGNTENRTGMSSPKRYLWDIDKQKTAWFLNKTNCPLQMYQFFSQDGMDVSKEKDIFAGDSYYSRSSIMSFAIIEILCHAISQINSYKFRKKRWHENVRRKLKRVVLTCPVSMSEKEKEILRKHAENAIEYLKLFYIEKGYDIFDLCVEVIPSSDELYIDYDKKKNWNFDEATSTQLAFIYGEITKKYDNEYKLYFDTEGSVKLNNNNSLPSVTLSTIDIGGGTTDIIVCDYSYDSKSFVAKIKPEPKFWEGFNIAGDDILLSIIEILILPEIKKSAESKGIHNSTEIMKKIFGEYYSELSSNEKIIKRHFANQIAMPIAMEYLSFASENGNIQKKVMTFNDFFINQAPPNINVINYINEIFNHDHEQLFMIQKVEWELDIELINRVVRDKFAKVIKNVSNIINQYQTDIVLLTGRPAKLPIIRDLFIENLPVTPDKIISLGDYKIGNWYPYSNINGKIIDPKTTVAVGASMALMSGTLNRLPNFILDTTALKKITSTANYIGVYDENEYIIKTILFTPGKDEEKIYYSGGHIYLGMKQFKNENWISNPLYKICYADNEKAKELAGKDLEITLVRRFCNDRPEEIEIINIIDVNTGTNIDSDSIKIFLQTITNDSGHWLDTGIFKL